MRQRIHRGVGRILWGIALIGVLACQRGVEQRAGSSEAALPHPELELGNEANNGGGIAEKTVGFVLLNLRTYLDFCLGSRTCHLSVEERPLLQSIRDGINRDGVSVSQLVFRSEKSSPGFFQVDGMIRSARTSNHPGARIYINTDHLYHQAPGDIIEPIDPPTAAALLVDEFAHQYGAGNQGHERLDVLGAKLQSLLSTRSERLVWDGRDKEILTTRPDPKQSHQANDLFIWLEVTSKFPAQNPDFHPFVVTTLNLPPEKPRAQLLVSDKDEIYDLSEQLLPLLPCTQIAKVTWYSVGQLHWHAWPESDADPVARELHGSLSVECAEPPPKLSGATNSWYRRELVVRVPFAHPFSSYPKVIRDRIRLRALDCEEHPSDFAQFCH